MKKESMVIAVVVIILLLIGYLQVKSAVQKEITVPSKGVIWTAPDNSKWRVTMDNDGSFNKEKLK
jgi:hypothetical protein